MTVMADWLRDACRLAEENLPPHERAPVEHIPNCPLQGTGILSGRGSQTQELGRIDPRGYIQGQLGNSRSLSLEYMPFLSILADRSHVPQGGQIACSRHARTGALQPGLKRAILLPRRYGRDASRKKIMRIFMAASLATFLAVSTAAPVSFAADRPVGPESGQARTQHETVGGFEHPDDGEAGHGYGYGGPREVNTFWWNQFVRKVRCAFNPRSC